MIGARVTEASTRLSPETSRAGSLRRAASRRYWVIAKAGFGWLEPLAIGLDVKGRALPLFTFEEEAEMFLWFRKEEYGWKVMETTPGQIVSILYGPCADSGTVLLNPLPEIEACARIDTVSVDRNEFVGSIIQTGARRRNAM